MKLQRKRKIEKGVWLMVVNRYCCKRYEESIKFYSWDEVWWQDEVNYCPFCGSRLTLAAPTDSKPKNTG